MLQILQIASPDNHVEKNYIQPCPHFLQQYLNPPITNKYSQNVKLGIIIFIQMVTQPNLKPSSSQAINYALACLRPSRDFGIVFLLHFMIRIFPRFQSAHN